MFNKYNFRVAADTDSRINLEAKMCIYKYLLFTVFPLRKKL